MKNTYEVNKGKIRQKKYFKYSIIVPVYNVEQYLLKCIESIINQNRNDLEVILVDDGSTDGSSTICDNYSNKYDYIKTIHKENGGLVSARKAGALISLGEYIMCVDGDDWIDDSYVSSMDEIIQEYRPDIICCGFYQANDNQLEKQKWSGRIGYYSRQNIIGEILPVLISDKNGIGLSPNVWAKAIRKSIYVKNQMKVSDKIKIGEDGACTVPCFIEASSIFVTDKCLYYYRYNPNSMTKERTPFSWDGLEQIYYHFKNIVDTSTFDFERQFENRMIHSIFNVSYTQFYQKKSYKDICREISTNLSRQIYNSIIFSNDKHEKFKLYLARLCLRYRLYFLMYLYSISKKRLGPKRKK
jgi:glycosyltransferase involved in cell wall biosynthesis